MARTRSLRFRTYKDKRGEWRWTLYGINGRKMADSGEGYKRKAGCIKAVEIIMTFAGTAVHEIDDGKAVVGRGR